MNLKGKYRVHYRTGDQLVALRATSDIVPPKLQGSEWLFSSYDGLVSQSSNEYTFPIGGDVAKIYDLCSRRLS